MGDAPRGRAKSRGRASLAKATKPQEQQEIVGAPLQGAWARRPGGTVPSETIRAVTQSFGRASISQTTVVQPPQLAAGPSGVAQYQQPQQEASGGSGGGGDASAAALGRGAMRGRRALNPELLETRPKHIVSKQGTGGRPIQLQANYFKMLTATDWCLYKYRVDFAPEEDRLVVRKALLRVHKELLGGYIFDGTVLYTSHRLPEPLEVFSPRLSDNEPIKIAIRLVGDMTRGDEHYLQFFNIIMRKCLEFLNLQLVGRDYFDARNKIEVREYRLELWPGYETSIRQHETDILMCAEIRHKVMRQQTLFDILNECYNRHGDGYQERFKAMVIGVTVLTDYNNHTYRVDDVDYKKSPRSTFMKKDQEISFEQYYFEKYQIRIRNTTQPILISRSNARDRRAGASETVSLIPELCRSTGLTDEMRNDHHMMRELATHTRLDPKGRITRLMSFNRRLQTEPSVKQELTQWNLKLDEKLVNLPARVMSTEMILFGNNSEVSAGDRADWTKEFRNRALWNPLKLDKWVMIIPSRLARDAEAFVGTMKTSTRSFKFPIAEPRTYILNDDRANGYTAAIEEIMSQSNPQLIFCVLMNNRADRYSAIKKKCCIDRPVATQCLLAKNLNAKGVQSIATKVVIQMSCKIGGAPWSVSVPVVGLMVAGFDVCHDTNVKGKDFGALVASLDRGFTKYFSAVSAHTTGEELSNDLAVNMCKALHKYREMNGAWPTRIVMYRDGVGDGQIPFVYEHEVENLKRKLGELYGDPSMVQLAYIIVTKRLSTRLFYNGGNPPPGTVVDDVITTSIKYDFYVVSQFISQGSVSPSGYSVISDNVNLDASKLQRLTYILTHMYFNWSGTVRVPAPCQFAHKLAFLVSQSIHASPSNHLDTVLYFL